jgi:5'-3' exonuclease
MEQNNITLIDADFLLFVATHNKKDEEIKSFEEVCKFADNMILDILDSTGAQFYIGALTIGKCFRYDIYPAYKANRKGLEKPAFFNELRDYLINKWLFVHHPGLEADDIISIIARKHPEAMICSMDKDLQQIPGLHFNPKTKQVKDVTKSEAEVLLWRQVITGDSTDNIKGIPRKGPKYVEGLFENITEDNKLYDIVLNAYVETLGVHKGIIEFCLNYRLVKLIDESEFGFECPILNLVGEISDGKTKEI